MKTQDLSKAQGHWILAKMGKKVLRPGGKELTQKLVSGLRISQQDEIAEFAPGLGYTASLALAETPKSYVGVDADADAVSFLKRKVQGKNVQFVLGNAAETGLESNSKDKVYGEAMLTMHADHRKIEIIKEAQRILKPGGLYAIHELGLRDVNEDTKTAIQRDLALAIKVNARPLTVEEWTKLLEDQGFSVLRTCSNPMHLLEPQRIFSDEGFFRTLKIGWNILTHQAARQRVMQMRKVFRQYQKHLNAIVVIAEKN